MLCSSLSSPASSCPRYQPNQIVHFIGGKGKVKSFFQDAGSWIYAIEMEMGQMPEMGRIGFETTILLTESDLEVLV